MTPCIWLGTTHSCNPPNYHYGLWVNLLFFMMCVYKHYGPPMLLVFAMKCFTNMPCLLPHNRYCCLLSSPTMYLPHLLICTCLISSPVACPKIAKNLPYLWMMSLTKKRNPKPKTFFFIADLKTCRVFWGFEKLSTAVGWGVMQLVSQPKYPWFSLISKYSKICLIRHL